MAFCEFLIFVKNGSCETTHVRRRHPEGPKRISAFQTPVYQFLNLLYLRNFMLFPSILVKKIIILYTCSVFKINVMSKSGVHLSRSLSSQVERLFQIPYAVCSTQISKASFTYIVHVSHNEYTCFSSKVFHFCPGY